MLEIEGSEPFDSWVLVPWGPWLYPPSFQVSVLLSMLLVTLETLQQYKSVEQNGGQQGHSASCLLWASLQRLQNFLSQSGGGSYYCLQMTFASIYLLHFDFAFNFRSIQVSALPGGCKIEAAESAVWLCLTAPAPERKARLTGLSRRLGSGTAAPTQLQPD